MTPAQQATLRTECEAVVSFYQSHYGATPAEVLEAMEKACGVNATTDSARFRKLVRSARRVSDAAKKVGIKKDSDAALALSVMRKQLHAFRWSYGERRVEQ